MLCEICGQQAASAGSGSICESCACSERTDLVSQPTSLPPTTPGSHQVREIRRFGLTWLGTAVAGARDVGKAITRVWRDKTIESTKQILQKATEETARGVQQAAGLARQAYDHISPSAEVLIEYGDDLYKRKLGEDEAQILDHCPVVAHIKEHRSTFESDPEVFGRLYNARLRPILTAAVLGATGGGAIAFDEVLTKVTRRVFDGDQLIGGWVAEKISSLVDPEAAESVNRFMDTVPGSTVPGGGWLHRIQHGHDLATLTEIAGEHGTGGVVQGLYHIYGRDFFTPAGIPILPAGSADMHKFLHNLGLGKEQAADLLSLNFVELIGGIMSVVALLRLWRLTKALRDNSAVRDLIERAGEAAEQQDYITATALLHEARSLRPKDGALSLALGTIHQRAGNRLQAYLAFRDASVEMATEEPTITLGGASLSLRGIAATMALSMSYALARSEEHGGSWLSHVRDVARTGVTALETTGHRLTDRRFLKRFGRGSLLPARHLSAALNFYLAGKLAGSSMFLADRDIILERAHRKIAHALTEIEVRPALCNRTDELRFLRRFIAAEFLPLSGGA